MDRQNNFGKGQKRPSAPNKKRTISPSLRDQYIAEGIFFAFFCLVLFFIFFAAIKISLRVKDGPSTVTYNYICAENGDEQKIASYKYDLSQIKKNDCYFVSLDDICSLLHLRYIGNYNQITLSDESGKEYITFEKQSQNCIINGAKCKLDAPSFEKDGQIYVPCDIFTQYYSAFSSSLDEENMTLNFTFKKDESNNSFAFKSISAISSVFKDPEKTEDRLSGKSIAQISFLSDLSSYEEYMNPYDCYQYLVLVNRTHALAPSNIPSNLCKIRDSNIPITVKLRLNAQMSLEAMLKEARANGYITLTVTEAYKSYGTIKTEFYSEVTDKLNKNSKLKKADAEKLVEEYKCRAGYDEFQTGLSCTLLNYGKSKQDFATSEEFMWLAQNCWKFGYIVRYPEDKTEITGESFQAWRFRYVGRYHAEQMNNLNMCLEEYTQYIDVLA